MSSQDIEVKDAFDNSSCFQPCKDLACEHREAFGEHYHKIVLTEDVTQFWASLDSQSQKTSEIED